MKEQQKAKLEIKLVRIAQAKWYLTKILNIAVKNYKKVIFSLITVCESIDIKHSKTPCRNLKKNEKCQIDCEKNYYLNYKEKFIKCQPLFDESYNYCDLENCIFIPNITHGRLFDNCKNNGEEKCEFECNFFFKVNKSMKKTFKIGTIACKKESILDLNRACIKGFLIFFIIF